MNILNLPPINICGYMAKPIRATPELKGEDARLFVENMEMKEKSRISKAERNLAKAIMAFTF